MSRSLRKDNERVAAVMGGGDWADASVDLLVAPVDFDFQAAHKRHRQWYLTVYRKQPQFRPGQSNPDAIKYLSFPEWLVRREGLRPADESEVVEVWDGDA